MPMRVPPTGAPRSQASLSPQLQAPLRRFLRQEMVVEVVRVGWSLVTIRAMGPHTRWGSGRL